MKILHTGPTRPWSITDAHRQAMVDLGHDVHSLDQAPYLDGSPRLLKKLLVRLVTGPYLRRYNRDLLEKARQVKPDLLFIDQGFYLDPETVRTLRGYAGLLVHYTSEFTGFRTYLYRKIFKVLDVFDVHVLTNTISAEMLRERGAKKIVMTHFGYNPRLHSPPSLTPADRQRLGSDAVFVGHWEPATEAKIAALRATGLQVSVWGSGWQKAKSLHDRKSIGRLPLEDSAKALACAKLGLCFLSKWNRNMSAGRSFEVPAVGGFLLAERTDDHKSYYEEGTEAEFFASDNEMVEKAKHYLAHDDERARIAAKGHQRCVSNYSYTDRVRDLLKAIVDSVPTPVGSK